MNRRGYKSLRWLRDSWGAPQPAAKAPKAKHEDKHAYEGSLDGISAGSDPEDEDGPRYARHENESHTGDNKREGVPCFESEFQIGNSGLLPHPPLVFGPNGEEVNPERRYEWKGGLAYVLTPGETGESFRTGYRDQVAYVASLLPGVIEEILTKSASPPIIIFAVGSWAPRRSRGDNGQSCSIRGASGPIRIIQKYYEPLNAHCERRAFIVAVDDKLAAAASRLPRPWFWELFAPGACGRTAGCFVCGETFLGEYQELFSRL